MTAARVMTRAVLVVHGTPRHLAEVFDALAGQSVVPDLVDVVTDTDLRVPLPDTLRATVYRVPEGSYRQMLEHHLESQAALAHEYLWLLHDDSAPLPDALEALTAAARKRPRAAILGAAHVEWKRPEVLVNVGSTVSRWGARRVALSPLGDVNQGQYHGRDDVLAVSLAGALVRREVFQQVGGLEQAYRGLGDSVELGRRCWNAGYDVVIVPQARVRHAQTTWRGTREGAPSKSTRLVRSRAGEWFHAMAWGPAWAVPLLWLWALAAVVPRAVMRIAHNTPALALAEFAVPVALASTMPRLVPVRRLHRRTRQRQPQSWAGLLAGPLTVMRYIRTRYFGLREYQRSLTRPSDVIAAELEEARARSRWMLGAALGLSTAVAAIVMGPLLLQVIRGQALVRDGWGLATLADDVAWDTWWHGWSEHEFGGPLLDGGYSAVALALVVAPGPTAGAVAVLVSLAIPVAAWSAWMAVGAVNRSPAVRALAAVAYGCWPWLIEAVSALELGTVLVHVLAPWVIWGAIRATGHQAGIVLGDGHEFPARRFPSPSAAMGAAVALAVVTAVVPMLAPVALLVVLVVAPGLGRRWWRVVPVVVPALVVAAPTMLAVVRAGVWSVEAARIGARQAGAWDDDRSVVLDQVLALPDGNLLGLAMVGAVLTVGAFAVLGVGAERVGKLVAVGLLVAGLGAAVAVLGLRIGGDQMAVVQPAVGMSWAWLGLMIAAAATVKRVTQPRPAGGPVGSVRTVSRMSPRARSAALVAAGVMTVTVAGQVAVMLVSVRDDLPRASTTDPAVLPLLATLETTDAWSGRVAVLTERDREPFTVVVSVMSTDGTSMLVDGPHRHGADDWWADPGASAHASGQVHEAVAGIIARDPQAPDLLAQWGVAVVVVPPGAGTVAAAVEQHPRLTLIGASERGTTWAIAGPDGADVSRVWFESTDGSVMPVANQRGRVDKATVEGPGVLVLATERASAWRAWDGDVSFALHDDPLGRVAFDIPAGTWEVSARYDSSAYQAWRWASMAVVAWAVVGMIPLRSAWKGRQR